VGNENHVIARRDAPHPDVAIRFPLHFKLQAISKNSFLEIWTEDFVPEKVLETPEYFVYCGVFKTHLWDERFAQSPKGEFLEVPYNLSFKNWALLLAAP